MATISTEERLKRAIEYHKVQKVSLRETSRQFDVPLTTLRNRIRGVRPISKRRNNQRLTEVEEEVIIARARALEKRGFPLRLKGIAHTANCILKGRNEAPVGHNWAQRFVSRCPELETRLARSLDYHRAFSEKPERINNWLEFYTRLRTEHNITSANVYNMDETGFQMGLLSSHVVVTGTSSSKRSVFIQPGNKDFTTLIACIGGDGYVMPPFLIFKGGRKVKEELPRILPEKWHGCVSERGWTSNDIALEWLDHFHGCTRDRADGGFRLLILDGHGSHRSDAFLEKCDNYKIAVACLPPHSSHLTQPLDVSCFKPLKAAYHSQLESGSSGGIVNVDRSIFLSAFEQAFEVAMRPDNAISAFRGAGLIPTDLGAVTKRINISEPDEIELPETPIPSSDPYSSSWEPQTPQHSKQAAKLDVFVKRKGVAGDPEVFVTSYNKQMKYRQKLEAKYHVAIGCINGARALHKRWSERRKRIANGKVTNRRQITACESGQTQENSADKGNRKCRECKETGHDRRNCPKLRKQNISSVNLVHVQAEALVAPTLVEEPNAKQTEPIHLQSEDFYDNSFTIIADLDSSPPPC